MITRRLIRNTWLSVLCVALTGGIFLILSCSIDANTALRIPFITVQVCPLKPLNLFTTNFILADTGRPLDTGSGKSRNPPQPPPFLRRTPKSVIEAVEDLINRSRCVQDQIVASVHPANASFANVLLPLAQDENFFSREMNVLDFQQFVSSDSQMRSAFRKVNQMINDYLIESAMNEDMFRLIDAAKQKQEVLDSESRKFLEDTHKAYIRHGLGIPKGPDRDRFEAISKRLDQLKIEFDKNISEEHEGFWVSSEDLLGLHEDIISTLTRGEGDNKGLFYLTSKEPLYSQVLQHAQIAETRKQIFLIRENKSQQNIGVFKEIVTLRDEAARLLGYPNHATVQIEDKMAKTPSTVNMFLDKLRTNLTQGGLTDIEVLKRLKQAGLQSQEEDFNGHFFLWDYEFYRERLLEDNYSVDQQRVMEYFPLQLTITSILELFGELFGLIFIEISLEELDRMTMSNPGDVIWSEDVRIFSVWNDDEEGGGFVGYLYLDLFPRDGKLTHSATFNLQPGFSDIDGKRYYPATAVVCNLSKPTSKIPSLLKHSDLITIFHELGHSIHNLVSKTMYSRFHGTNAAHDFIEMPSQMLENWCWIPSLLKRLGRHYSTISADYRALWEAQMLAQTSPPEQLPDDLIMNLVHTRNVNSALSNLRQLHFGIFDMTVHQPGSHQEIEQMKISETFNILRKEITYLEGQEVLTQRNDWAHGETIFHHLVDGYDAGYYGYLSSQVYSADIFRTAFMSDPVDREEGRRYRYTILEKGGSIDEMEILKEFLHREPRIDAFFENLGLAL